jgi:hypothetical protein
LKHERLCKCGREGNRISRADGPGAPIRPARCRHPARERRDQIDAAVRLGPCAAGKQSHRPISSPSRAHGPWFEPCEAREARCSLPVVGDERRLPPLVRAYASLVKGMRRADGPAGSERDILWIVSHRAQRPSPQHASKKLTQVHRDTNLTENGLCGPRRRLDQKCLGCRIVSSFVSNPAPSRDLRASVVLSCNVLGQIFTARRCLERLRPGSPLAAPLPRVLPRTASTVPLIESTRSLKSDASMDGKGGETQLASPDATVTPKPDIQQ